MYKKALALAGLLFLAAAANAQTILIDGATTGGSGALVGLAPPGTPFAGDIDWSVSLMTGGQVTLGGFCFTDDAENLPPASVSCGALTPVPLLPTGAAAYDPAGAPPGSTFQQAGTTFNGVSGLLRLLAFSPTFGVNIDIDLTFNGDGTGTVFANAGALGDVTGDFIVTNFGPPPIRTGGNTIPVMPGFGLVLVGLGLVFTAYRYLRKAGMGG